MKLVTLLLLTVISLLPLGGIELTTDRRNPYIREIIKIEATVPGEDTQAPVKLLISHDNYELIDRTIGENFTYNNLTGESFNSVTFRYTLYIKEAVDTYIQCNVDGILSNRLKISVKPVNLDKNKLPYLKTELNSTVLYTGEIGYVTNVLFSNNYIGNVNFIRPFMDLNASKLNGTSRREVVLDDIEAQFKIVSAYSIYSKKPGEYTIPSSKILYEDYNFITPAYSIKIKNLPDDISNNHIIGRSLIIKSKNILDSYNNGDNIEFYITLEGNANLNKVTTLSHYFKTPSYLTEKEESRVSKIEDGELKQIVKFSYRGRVNSFTGVSLNNIKIPFFNTTSGSKEIVELEGVRTQGNIPLFLLYGGFLLFLGITIGTILFTFKFFKKEKGSSPGNITTPAENFNLSRREKEIFTILVNGKSTKEIAEELYISPETVKKHIQSILKKTNTNSRLELLALVNTLN